MNEETGRVGVWGSMNEETGRVGELCFLYKAYEPKGMPV